MNIIQNKGELNQAIRNILHTGRALDEQIHQAAVSALWHAREYGDPGFFERLCEAMPKGSRVEGLKFWAKAHSPLTVKENGRWGIKKASPEAWKIQAAIAKPFWDFSKEKKPGNLSAEALINYLRKVAEGDFVNDKGETTKKVDKKAQELAAAIIATLPA